MRFLIVKTLLKVFKFKLSLIILLVSTVAFSQNSDCKLKIGTNLSGICDWMTEMPFVDMMHNARTWGTRNQIGWIEGGVNEWNTELADSIEKDENGYPLEVPFYIDGLGLEDSQIVFTVWALLAAWDAGEYTCIYDGEGEIQFGADGEIISSKPGVLKVRIKPSIEGNYLEMKIMRSKRGNHIRNVRLLMPGHETTYQNKPFNPLYLEKLEPFKALRFMDWGQTNNWGHDNSWTCDDGPEDTILTRWNERSKMSNYTWAINKGVPYEMMCDLCNALNKDMWVCVPYSASNEFISEMAKLIKSRLNPGLKVYAEYGNENWNWMFGQTQWLNTFFCVGRGMDWPEGIVDKTQNNLDIWTRTFTDQPERLIRVVGVQTAWQDVANRIVRNLKPESFDAVAITGYFGLSENGDTVLDKLGDNAKVADVAYWVRKEMVDNEIDWIRSDYEELGIPLNKKIVYYEAGQHITPTPFGEEPTYAQALLNIQRDTTIYNLYKEWFGTIEKLIPEGDEALYMNFSFVGDLSARYGSWGILETLNQDTSIVPAPKYQAIMEQIQKCEEVVRSGVFKEPSRQSQLDNIKVINRGHQQYVVVSKSKLKEVNLFDVNGRHLDEFKIFHSDFIDLNLAGVHFGIYLIKIKTENFETTKKVIVN